MFPPLHCRDNYLPRNAQLNMSSSARRSTTMSARPRKVIKVELLTMQWVTCLVFCHLDSVTTIWSLESFKIYSNLTPSPCSMIRSARPDTRINVTQVKQNINNTTGIFNFIFSPSEYAKECSTTYEKECSTKYETQVDFFFSIIIIVLNHSWYTYDLTKSFQLMLWCWDENL